MTSCGEQTSSTVDSEQGSAVSSVPESQPQEVVTSVPIGHEKAEEYGKVIALTFDDGPNTTTTGEVLDVLEKYGVRGTFFLIGDNINEQSAENVKRAYQMGCEIANHSKTHSYMNKMSDEDIKAEIAFTNEKIKDIIGKEPSFFRPPYIATNSTMYETIDLTFICGLGCEDYEPKVDAQKRYEKTIEQACDGAIILLHDSQGNFQTVQALEMIIPELQKQGYEFVTCSELFFAKGVEVRADDANMYSVVEKTE